MALDKSMEYYRQIFDEMMETMEQLHIKNSMRLNNCYLFMKDRGVLAEYESRFGALSEDAKAVIEKIPNDNREHMDNLETYEEAEEIAQRNQGIESSKNEFVITSFEEKDWVYMANFIYDGRPGQRAVREQAGVYYIAEENASGDHRPRHDFTPDEAMRFEQFVADEQMEFQITGFKTDGNTLIVDYINNGQPGQGGVMSRDGNYYVISKEGEHSFSEVERQWFDEFVKQESIELNNSWMSEFIEENVSEPGNENVEESEKNIDEQKKVKKSKGMGLM